MKITFVILVINYLGGKILGVTATRLFGWELPHPIIIASGPFSRDLKSISQLFTIGAAAVVTKTIIKYPQNRKGGCIKYDNQTFNRDGYSNNSLELWESDLENLRHKKVIASIFGDTPDELAELAKFVVARGIEVVELCLSCPTYGNDPICNNSYQLEEYCKSVRKAIDVPILAKTLLSTSRHKNREMASCIKNCGIDGISISDSFPAIILNKLDGSMHLGGIGGLSGPALKPLVLKSIYDIANIGLTIVGIGGIENSQDIIDYIHIGATAVQVCSHFIRNKISSINDLKYDLYNNMIQRNVNLNDICGKSNLIKGDC